MELGIHGTSCVTCRQASKQAREEGVGVGRTAKVMVIQDLRLLFGRKRHDKFVRYRDFSGVAVITLSYIDCIGY